MNVVVFGATGGTGRAIVQAALEQGHRVTAFVRDAAKLAITHERLSIATGDVMDAAAVEAAVSGHDAVVCALGTPATTKTTVRSQGTRNILAAMRAARVERLVCVSSMGIGDSKPMLPPLYRWLLVPLLLKQGFAEHELQEASIRGSDTAWTIVRPGALTNGARSDAMRHGFVPEAKGLRAKVSRADVAAFVVDELAAARHVHATPWLSY